jgi:hypothetical protein
MNRGILIIAHDSNSIKYSELSVIAARLAAKHLQLPVSLITDSDTVKNLTSCEIATYFDRIILTEKPTVGNPRMLYGEKVNDFLNSTRAGVWDLTPYDHTLLIDSDYLIFSDRLSKYWELDEDFLICEAMVDPAGSRLGDNDHRVSDIAPSMRWATIMMFKRNNRSRLIFDLVDHIRENYNFYADTYFFDERQFRNDIAFTIAEHIVNGYSQTSKTLPRAFMTMITDTILSIDKNKIKFNLVEHDKNSVVTFENTDVHVMNKLNILEFKDELLK